MKYPYGRNIIITGASSGIGLASAEVFAKSGYCVWALSRRAKPMRTKKCGAGKIIEYPCDVTSEESVKCAMEIATAKQNIGIVLHSAGIGISGAAEDTEELAVKAQFETNFFGVLRINRYILPHMRNNGKGLVIVMSSVAAQTPIPFQSHYSSSKSALETYAQALRMEVKPFGIKVAIVEPGDTKTSFTQERQKNISSGSAYFEACNRAVSKMEKDEQNGHSPYKPAVAALKISERNNPPIRNVVGGGYKTLMILKRILPDSLVEYAIEKIYLV